MKYLKQLVKSTGEIVNLLNLILHCLIAMSNGESIVIHQTEKGIVLERKNSKNQTLIQ